MRFVNCLNNPIHEAIRSVVRENARQLARNIRRTKNALNELQMSMDQKIAGAMEEVNLLLRQIAKLNTEITKIENESGKTGDLRDQRDLKIRKLAEYLEIKVYSDNRGQYTVNAVGIGSLVAGGHVQELSGQRSPDSDSYIPGGVEIYFRERPNYRLSRRMSHGQLGAVLGIRNAELKSLQKRIDDLAFDLANAVNAIHRRGVTMEGATGIDFFDNPVSRFRAADTFDLSEEVQRNVQNIVTALQPSSPGDNRIAIAITKLQDSKILDQGTSTFEDFYLKGVGRIAAEARGAQVNKEHSMGIWPKIRPCGKRFRGFLSTKRRPI